MCVRVCGAHTDIIKLLEPSAPTLMSLTMVVPAAVPSLDQSSLPWVPSSAKKSTLSPRAVSTALDAHPSAARHVSGEGVREVGGEGGLVAVSEEEAECTRVPLCCAASDVWHIRTRLEAALPGTMSLTMTVPAAVPSDFQSSLPWVPSLAEKKIVCVMMYVVPLRSF